MHDVFIRLLRWAWIGILLPLTSVIAVEPVEWADQHLDEIVLLYQHFHRTPELSFHEKQTAERVADELESCGAQVTRNVGGFGVVAVLKNGDGPTLMLRTDLDGLPVTEQTNLVYASQVRTVDDNGAEVGVMHACGHDIHITNLIASAKFLSQHKNLWSGTLVMIGQPAEEKGAGATAMLDDGLFKRFPKPDFALALHVDSNLGAGKVSCLSGYSMANVDSVDVTMKGAGGHGAQPHTTIDPIVQAAHLVMDLQTLVSREIKPTDPGVVTVGAIHGGTKHNVIGDTCHLQITVRSYSDEVRSKLLAGIQRKAKAVAASANAPQPEVEISEGTPSLWNDAELTNRLTRVFQNVLGASFVEQGEPSMGGEDFSQYGKQGVPILMYRLGSVEQKRLDRFRELGQPAPSLHSPLFYPDAQPTLRTAVITTCSSVLELLPAKR
ncbi:MAG: amidohydrolase [Pirellulaceae bacterium]